MKMSEEMAVRLHRMMWSDMQKELGDTPDSSDRNRFKEKWCKTHFPGDHISFNCFLCDYCGHNGGNKGCDNCPVEWPDNTCSSVFGQPPAKTDYRFAPISEILALPTRNKVFTDEKAAYKVGTYYQFREALLSQASGIPASAAISDHVKAIQEKAVQQSNLSKVYGDAKMELAKASGLPAADATTDHIAEIRKKEDRTTMEVLENFSGLKGNGLWIVDHVKKIQEKAVEEKAENVIYDFLYRCEKYPDIPINERLKKRLCAIQEKAVEEYFAKTPGAKLATMDVDQAFKQYADEQKAPIFKQLSNASGLSENNHAVLDHIILIKNKAKQEGRDETKQQMKDLLAERSGLNRNIPIDDHIHEIVKNSMEAGAAEERDRIQEKIYEVLLS